MFNPSVARVLVTGSSAGLGAALAAAYRAKGWEVQGLSRRDPVWPCDLADPAQVARLVSDPGKLSGFDLAVFAAGTSEVGLLEDLPPEAFRRCLEVNFLAPITLFRALAAAPRPCRRFVFVLSGAAEVLAPGLSPYAVGKRALKDYLAFRGLERAYPDVRILCVWPGPMATGFDAATRVHGNWRLRSASSPRSPEEVARRVLEAEEAGRRRLVLSPLACLVGRLQSLAPGLIGALMRRR